jgi:hypothetical protein
MTSLPKKMMNSSKRLKNLKETCMCWRERAKCNLLKITVITWLRSLRRVQSSQAQLLNNTSRSTKARFKKRKRGMPLHISPPSSRLKKQSPRREEDQPEGVWHICKEKGHSAVDCTQASSTDQGRSDRLHPGWLDWVWLAQWRTTTARRRKLTPQARSLHANLDMTCKWIPS